MLEMPYALEMSLRLAWVVNVYSLVLVRICSELNQRKRLQLVTARKSSAVVCGQCSASLTSAWLSTSLPLGTTLHLTTRLWGCGRLIDFNEFITQLFVIIMLSKLISCFSTYKILAQYRANHHHINDFKAI